ncbi:hypothetical protein Tco_0618581 [Tanacetum coccineum]
MLREQAANLSTHTLEPSRCFNFIYDDDDDDEESTIPLSEITSQLHPSIAITPVLPTVEPEDSLNMRDEHLSTIPEKESDEVIKSSVEDFVPIPMSDAERKFMNSSLVVSHPAKAETRGVTSWISSQHNGVNNREPLYA